MDDQLSSGKLVCPVTHQRLSPERDLLNTADRALSYACADGVPLLIDPTSQRSYREEQDEAMYRQYGRKPRGRLAEAVSRVLFKAYVSPAAHLARREVLDAQGPGALCLAIGGGPGRVHPALVNLNIDAFENVDVVGDVYALPYADGVVDAICCDALLEHLEEPARAVDEMFRVLRPGGQLFSQTPFLQAFHAFPNHFQNFTLEGHNRLFARSGFKLISAGAAVGPSYAVSDLTSVYVRNYLPGPLGRIGQYLLLLVARLVRPLDRLLLRSPDAHRVASAVFARVVKP